MNLTFAQPAYFLLLIVLPVLVILKLVADARQRTLVRRAAAARLLPRLVHRRQPWRDWTAVTFELIGLGLLITVLARPQLGMVEEEIITSGRSVMLALDTSRSMLVEDLRPNRLIRTKLVMNDLIVKLPTDRIGLIAFAGKPFLQAPVTQDHDALLETLEQCDTDIIPRGGSNLAEAIDLAISTFKSASLPAGKSMESLNAEEKALLEKSQATSQALIIFSDGEELEGTALTAAQRAKDAGVTIISVGVGTAKGGVVPNPDTKGRDYMRDEKGALVMSGLNKDILEKVASITRGLYLPLDEVVNDNRLNLILSKLDASTNKNKTLKKAVDRYQWPLAGSLCCFLIAVCMRILRRRPMGIPMAFPTAAVLALLATPLPSQGATIDTSAVARYESALNDLQNRPSGSPEHLAWQRLGEGAVAYTNGDFDKALEKFGKALLGNDPSLRTQAHFNLGNSFYARAKFSASKAKNPDPEILGHLMHQLEDCIANYQATLTLNPQHKEAAGNKKIAEDLLKKLKEQKQQQEQKGDKKDKSDKKDKKEQGDKGEDGDKEKGDKGEKGEQPGDSNPGQEKGDKGEGSGEPKSPGEEPSKEDGSGKEGDKPKDSGEGQEPKEGDKGKKPDERSEAQKEQEKAAQEESNKERDGQVEAMKNQQGEKPGDSKPSADERKNEKTGFSRSEARRNLEHFSDDVKVRQQIETARPDRPFKNW